MKHIAPNIVKALLTRPEAYDPDHDLRALRESAAASKAPRGVRRRYRFSTWESGRATVSTVRPDDDASVPTA